MCGIAGICNFMNKPVENIQAMNQKMLRRGPDAGGYWLDESDRVVLGHRRLSIVELTDAGAQPMLSKSGRFVITFNGEIYNYKNIINKMSEEGFTLRLRGGSDTEVLLEAIEFYGIEKTLNLIKGMFAFAIYDRQERILYLSRDRMGEKPLYYGRVNGSFVFASDIASIKSLEGFHNAINQEVLELYFHYGYIPQPYSIYKDIWKLPPGGLLKVPCPFVEWKESLYWDISSIAHQGQLSLFAGDEKEASEQLESLLKKAIKEQMMADVPLGAFLSGGIDSTLVVSLMQSLSMDKVRTFTVGFEENAYNEASFAKETAAYLGTDHTELYVGIKDAMEALQNIPKAFSEPFADSSQLPTMLVSKMTRQHVTVSLSGDAGDELFCGYNTYKEMANGLQIIKSKLGFLPSGLRSSIGKTCARLSNSHTPLLYKTGNCLAINSPEEYYRGMVKTDCRISYLGKERSSLLCSNDRYPQGFLKGGENNLMLMDMKQYLPDDILVKVDRSGMFYSLESRIPLLDRDVVEFAWSLPLSYKLQNGTTKKILRNILYKYVPKEMMERPKKGFGIPIEKWLQKGEMKEWAESILLDAREIADEFLNCKLIDAMWSEYNKKQIWNPHIWYILILEQWLLNNKI